LLGSTENLEKSNDIMHFGSIENINHEMLSSRYRPYLTEATDMNNLKIILSQCIHADILERSKLTDGELLEVYKKYCEKYNLRRGAERAVKKFREYCKERKIQ
jgi:Cdc6-like AAA superfamily ATPase